MRLGILHSDAFLESCEGFSHNLRKVSRLLLLHLVLSVMQQSLLNELPAISEKLWKTEGWMGKAGR